MAWVLPGKVIAGEKKLWRGSYLFRCHWGASFLSLSFPLSLSSSFFPSLSPTLLFPLALSNHAFLQWYTDSPRTKSRYAGWNGLSVSVGVFSVKDWVFESVLPSSWLLGPSSFFSLMQECTLAQTKYIFQAADSALSVVISMVLIINNTFPWRC